MVAWAMAEAIVKYLSIPQEHPVFRGHFPGNPIVPGVMLLEWVTGEVARALGRAPATLRVREAKFFSPLEPMQQARLTVELGEQRCAFDIQRDAERIARGILEWNARD
jgi:3-hydroxymyristoyl/3-hydroxydecanoyl-(acyl carrier protein) dehydratase